MILFDVTYNNLEDIKEINKIVGKPINFINAIKLKGTGSGRMIIDNVSYNFEKIINDVNDINYGNIELRPKGILIHTTKQLYRFCWVIPYYKLVIYNTDFFSIYSDSSFIRFKKDKRYLHNKKFISKMINFKNDQLLNYNLNEIYRH